MSRKPFSIVTKLLFLSMFSISTFAGNGDLPNGRPFQNLQNQINIINLTIAEQISIFNEKFSQLEAENDSQDDLIAAMQVALSILETRATMNKTDIEALQAADALSAQLISTLQSQLAALQASTSQDITNLYNQSNSLNLLISALRRDVNTNASTISLYLDELRAVDNLLGRNCASPLVFSGITTLGFPVCVLPEGNNLQTYTIIRGLTRFSFCDSSALGVCLDTDYYQNGSAFCNSGDIATGGGFRTGGFGDIGGNGRSLTSRPNGNTGWFVQTIQQGAEQATGNVYVKCLRN